jgi:hypothetical protein
MEVGEPLLSEEETAAMFAATCSPSSRLGRGACEPLSLGLSAESVDGGGGRDSLLAATELPAWGTLALAEELEVALLPWRLAAMLVATGCEEPSVISISILSNVLTEWLATRSVCGSACPVTGLFLEVSNHRAIAARS